MVDIKYTAAISSEQLIKDMLATFPGLMARPGALFGKDYAGCVWTGGTGDSDGCMHDGLAIFNSFANSCDEDSDYNGTVHCGFEEWLKRRGWYNEKHDDETYILYTIATAESIGHVLTCVNMC